MKRISLLLILFLFTLASCKKDSVDATNLKTFQSSINDMATSLTTLEQIKFNEALYILKTFGVEADGDTHELNLLSKMLEGKKVPEILAMADEVAQRNGIAWTSGGPPSLGEMNIFGKIEAKETDPNEIIANGLSITVNPISFDSILGPKALQVVPRLVDRLGKPIDFRGAALEVIMVVSSNGTPVSTSKNLMQDNNFKGFTIRFPDLTTDKISDNKIDISVSVAASNKTYKMSKIGVEVNPKAVRQPSVTTVDPYANEEDPVVTPEAGTVDPTIPPATASPDPKVTVQRFLNNLSSQNLRGAYENAQNPNWGSYETFSNPTSGFGSVKNLSVKNINSVSTSANSASVNATYDVTDKNGNTTALKVTFGLKNVGGEWKISSYKIN